jgi:feruloyl esterase
MKTMSVAAILLAVTSAAAFAKADCSADAVNALHVRYVHVEKAVAGSNPGHCAIEGTIETHGAGVPNGSARFAMQLPDAWQQRFFFMGVGGNAGTLTPSVNPTDRLSALGKGYATIVQDSGHSGDGKDAGWLKKPDGSRDTAKMADFQYRAAHSVTEAGKALAKAYYGAPVKHAYFDGCSTGGRMAMMEAERYPADYDGIIAGDPAMDYHSTILRIAVQKAALSSKAAYLPQDTLAMVDRLVNARCAAEDGLVHDLTSCKVKPAELICKPGAVTDCLSPEQAAVLTTYTTPLHDRRGTFLYPGWAITNLAGPRGASWWNTGDTAPDVTNPEDPWAANRAGAPSGWTYARQAVSYWMGMGPETKMLGLDIDPATNTVGASVVAAVDRTFGPMETKNPAKMLPFIQQGRKLIFYHGNSDPAIPAIRTAMFYDALNKITGGKAAANVRLFLVPGMQHCSGGPGPDQFDTLSAIEAWVEHGKAPEVIPATTKPDAPVKHALPLCSYPKQSRYSGAGAVTDAANWACK